MRSTIEYILEVVLKARPKKPPPGAGRPMCLKSVSEKIGVHQLGFDGEHIIKKTLEEKGWKDIRLTTHKAKIDIYARDPKGKLWNIEAKAHRSTAKKFQADIRDNQIKGKVATAKAAKARGAVMVVVVDYGDPKKGLGWAHVRFKEGFGAYRFSAMEEVTIHDDWLKKVGRGQRALIRKYNPYDKRDPKLWYKWNSGNQQWEWRPGEDKARKTRRKKGK